MPRYLELSDNLTPATRADLGQQDYWTAEREADSQQYECIAVFAAKATRRVV